METSKSKLQKMFGQNVQKYRKKAGLTQAVLSERLNISQKHLSIIETGTQFASATLIEKICTELEVSPSALFGEDMNTRQINNLYLMISQHIDRKIEMLYARLCDELQKIKT